MRAHCVHFPWRCRRLLIALFLVTWTTTVSASLTAAAQRVLVVHSYHEDQKEHVVEMTRGIEEALADTSCTLRYFHMDTKRRDTEEWKRSAGKKAHQLVAEYHPQVVIAMDDNAQEYFAKDYARTTAPPYFVFGGVNADPRRYGFPTDHITGVLERPNIIESLQLLKKISPAVKTIVMLADNSETSDAFISYCQSLHLPVIVMGYEQPATLDDLLVTLDRSRTQVDALGLYTLRSVARSTADPTKVPEREIVRMINERYNLPTVGFFDTAADAGVLCGVSVSMREQGFAAGMIARGLLEGKKPTDFVVKPIAEGRIQLNLRTAERLGIQLPYTMIQRADVVIR